MPGGTPAGVSIAALDDTTAIAAWPERGELRAAIIHGDSVRMIPAPVLPAIEGKKSPKFRRHPEGGYWLAWGGDLPHIKLAHYLAGGWAPAESIQCAYVDADQYIAGVPNMSHDDRIRPVVAWSAYSTRTGRNTICVSCPTDSGYPIAEELPQVNDGFLASPARDENGDVWLAWWKYYDGAFWIHSYTNVEVTDAVVSGTPFLRRVDWTLSGAAPESWWSVLRAAGEDTTYSVVGRVQAGASTVVGWTDSSTIDGTYRYRIRRDCKDLRYVRLSEPIVSDSGELAMLPLRLASEAGNPVRGAIRLRVEGAAPGDVQVEVYDVRGRRVGGAVGLAGATGAVSMNANWAGRPAANRPRAGLYFARARDVRGRLSSSLKLVVL